jgi:ubiquinone/menaquinone biosynthesis C-methylase UbiE
MPNYSDLIYWDNRYQEQKELSFEWLEDYDSLEKILQTFKSESTPEPFTLVVGCGNSELSEKMYSCLNVKNIYNIDFSSNVIKYMTEKHRDKPELQWEVMDTRDLKLGNEQFDLVIDKGTMDSLLCGENALLGVALLTKEVQRVLKTNGVYMLVSHGQPDSRVPLLMKEHLSFQVSYQILKKNVALELKTSDEDLLNPVTFEQTHYVYLCKKKPNADSVCQQNFPSVYCNLEKGLTIEEDDELQYMDGDNTLG